MLKARNKVLVSLLVDFREHQCRCRVVSEWPFHSAIVVTLNKINVSTKAAASER